MNRREFIRTTAARAGLAMAPTIVRPTGNGGQGSVIPDSVDLPAPPGPRRTWIEGFPAPGSLRPLMQAIGKGSGFSTEGGWFATEIFPLFMGVCGDAFRFAWYRMDGSPLERADAYVLSPPAAQYLPALQAAGFGGRVVFSARLTGARRNTAWAFEPVRDGIVASIAKRRWPALVVDLPEPGWTALVTGYEKGGETLVGWCEPGWESFGFRFEADKKRRFENWFASAGGAVLLTSRRRRPPEADVLRAALQRAVPELRRRAVGRLHAGPATFEVLAERITDPSLSRDDPDTARRRDALMFPMIWDLATQRHYAAEFVKHSADVFPAASDLLTAAADRFRQTHDDVWEINRIGGGQAPGSALPDLVDATLRSQVADIVLRCRDRDLEAAGEIEGALRTVAAQRQAT